KRLKYLLLLKCLLILLKCLERLKFRLSIRNRVTSYSIQKPDGHCNIPAVLVDRDRKFCANPQKYWVRILIERVDAMLQGQPTHKKKKKIYIYIYIYIIQIVRLII
uniref:Chemokine interleukin-8-like domain-containing protein n=1 Tax=Sinocyclocheilus grahami TaxID=75366 RepID=A0A672KPZ3_SINGR